MTQLTSGNPDDFELMAAIADRDESGLRQLFSRYKSRVFAFCCQMLPGKEEAEDCLLEVFWEIWDRPDRYDPNRTVPRTYLMMLARSRAIDRLRSLEVRRGIRGHSLTDNVVDKTASVTVEHSGSAGIAEAIRSLSPEQQQVIHLSFFHGHTHSEISELLGLPLGTVKARIRRGLTLLRELFGNPNIDKGLS